MKPRKTLKEIFDYHSRRLDEMNEGGFTAKFESRLLDDLGSYTNENKELLELYRELTVIKDELISVAYFDEGYYFIRKPEANLEKPIKELENETIQNSTREVD